MPLYDFNCRECGEFSEFRTIAERNHPTLCPDCEKPAQRLILAPNLALMNPSARRAHGINEKSRHEPRVSNAHSCGSGCGCGTSTPVRKNRVKDTKLGQLQSQKATARPWMLGH